MNKQSLGAAAMLVLSACVNVPDQAGSDELAADFSVKDHWLVGCWQHGDGASREVWEMAAPDLMFGYSVSLSEDRLRAFEDLRIEPSGGKLVYVASPNGTSSTRFAEAQQTGTSMTFENPDHDFPQRIEYALTETGVMATISTLDRGQSYEIPMRACN